MESFSVMLWQATGTHVLVVRSAQTSPADSRYEQLMKDEETLCCMKGLKHHRHDLYNM